MFSTSFKVLSCQLGAQLSFLHQFWRFLWKDPEELFLQKNNKFNCIPLVEQPVSAGGSSATLFYYYAQLKLHKQVGELDNIYL